MKSNITLLLDRQSVLDTCQIPYLEQASLLKVYAREADIPKWFEWGLQFREKGVIFSLPDTTIPHRSSLLLQAAKIFDYVELNAAVDLEESFQKIPLTKRMLFWKGPVKSVAALAAVFQQLKTFGGTHYELVTIPENLSETLIPLQFQKLQTSTQLTTYATGLSGMWTQILSPYFGAAMVSGKSGNNDQQPYFSIAQLLNDYHFPNLRPFRKIFGIAGNPVLGSFSPKMHNGAYQALNIPALYLPFHIHHFSDFWEGIIKNKARAALGLDIAGLTSVSPFKKKGIEYVDAISSPLVLSAKAGNLLVKTDHHWVAMTTDSLAVMHGLMQRNINPKKMKAAVIGCGGAGRTIAFALKNAGAKVTLVNRSIKHGVFAKKLLNLPLQLLKDFQPTAFNIVINATPVGMTDNAMPFEVRQMKKNSIVIDLVYRKTPTRLVDTAHQMGLTVIDGFEILRTQVRHQFAGMTGQEMPEALAYQLAQPENNFVN